MIQYILRSNSCIIYNTLLCCTAINFIILQLLCVLVYSVHGYCTTICFDTYEMRVYIHRAFVAVYVVSGQYNMTLIEYGSIVSSSLT